MNRGQEQKNSHVIVGTGESGNLFQIIEKSIANSQAISHCYGNPVSGK